MYNTAWPERWNRVSVPYVVVMQNAEAPPYILAGASDVVSAVAKAKLLYAALEVPATLAIYSYNPIGYREGRFVEWQDGINAESWQQGQRTIKELAQWYQDNATTPIKTADGPFVVDGHYYAWVQVTNDGIAYVTVHKDPTYQALPSTPPTYEFGAIASVGDDGAFKSTATIGRKSVRNPVDNRQVMKWKYRVVQPGIDANSVPWSPPVGPVFVIPAGTLMPIIENDVQVVDMREETPIMHTGWRSEGYLPNDVPDLHVQIPAEGPRPPGLLGEIGTYNTTAIDTPFFPVFLNPVLHYIPPGYSNLRWTIHILTYDAYHLEADGSISWQGSMGDQVPYTVSAHAQNPQVEVLTWPTYTEDDTPEAAYSGEDFALPLPFQDHDNPLFLSQNCHADYLQYWLEIIPTVDNLVTGETLYGQTYQRQVVFSDITTPTLPTPPAKPTPTMVVCTTPVQLWINTGSPPYIPQAYPHGFSTHEDGTRASDLYDDPIPEYDAVYHFTGNYYVGYQHLLATPGPPVFDTPVYVQGPTTFYYLLLSDPPPTNPDTPVGIYYPNSHGTVLGEPAVIYLSPQYREQSQ